jgi:hypothetical protein
MIYFRKRLRHFKKTNGQIDHFGNEPGSSHNGNDADHLAGGHQIEMICQLPEVSQYIQVDVCKSGHRVKEM